MIRLLTRLLFVWFIKEKGLIPPELFELDDLQTNILKNISPYHDLGLFKQVNQDSIYYKAILQNLCFRNYLEKSSDLSCTSFAVFKWLQRLLT